MLYRNSETTSIERKILIILACAWCAFLLVMEAATNATMMKLAQNVYLLPPSTFLSCNPVHIHRHALPPILAVFTRTLLSAGLHGSCQGHPLAKWTKTALSLALGWIWACQRWFNAVSWHCRFIAEAIPCRYTRRVVASMAAPRRR